MNIMNSVPLEGNLSIYSSVLLSLITK